MSENVFAVGGTLHIFNGGDPLGDCPTDWEKAKAWESSANEGRDKYTQPIWSWDCGYKLDLDGPIVSVSSRFYPPKTHYGSKWDGWITVEVLGKATVEKKFECETLEELRRQAEAWIEEFASKLSKFLEATNDDQ